MPNINMQYKPSGNTPAERLAQLENFVFTLTERLTYCLAHLDSENVSEGILTDSSGESYEKEITDLSVKLSALISGLSKVATSGKYSDLMGAPASLPASDVYPWAKEPEKPAYTCGEIGADSAGAAAAALISAKSYADSITDNKADKSETVSGFSVLGTTVTYTKADGSSGSFETEDTQYSVSSPETDGLMSAADKKKLDSVTEDRMALWDSSSIDGSKAVGNPVVMDGLQGGVPFSEITIDGKNIFDGSLSVGMVTTANGTIVASKKYISTTNLISVKPNTRYIAQNSENKTLDSVVYFDKNKSVIGHTYASAAGFNSFTTPDKCSFIMWRYLFDTDQNDTSALTNIQLEEGGAITSYEPPITGREITLSACGKNLLKYPYKAVFPIANQNGLSATENDGIITIDGEMTASSNNTQILLSIQKLKAATYTISGCAPGGDTSVFRVRVGNADAGTQICGDIGSGMSFTLSEETNVQISIQIFQNAVLNNAVFKPQLELGAAATAYEPYSGAEYKITPDSNPYTVPTDIRQLEGRNTLYTADSGAQLAVIGCNKSPTLAHIYEIINSLITTDSNGDVILNY